MDVWVVVKIVENFMTKLTTAHIQIARHYHFMGLEFPGSSLGDFQQDTPPSLVLIKFLQRAQTAPTKRFASALPRHTLSLPIPRQWWRQLTILSRNPLKMRQNPSIFTQTVQNHLKKLQNVQIPWNPLGRFDLRVLSSSTLSPGPPEPIPAPPSAAWPWLDGSFAECSLTRSNHPVIRAPSTRPGGPFSDSPTENNWVQ